MQMIDSAQKVALAPFDTLELMSDLAYRWAPLTGMPAGSSEWGSEQYEALTNRWESALQQLADQRRDRSLLDIYLAERQREFAIETGQIEGLYTLKRGVTEQLITEGLEGVRGQHTTEGLDDRTIRGLLEDQNTAPDLVFATIKGERPLSHSVLCEWHALLTRHQDTVTGLTLEGRRVQVEFKEKGVYKTRPNNPRRPDGVIHEYCPPEHCRSEMDRLFELYGDIGAQQFPVAVEAAWLHHRFVRTHPFRDGNGRMARLLMASSYIRQSLPPPVITAANRGGYIEMLEMADEGNLRPFCEYLEALANETLTRAVLSAERVLAGSQRMNHPNGGVTSNGRYYPPDPPPHETEGREEIENSAVAD